MPRAQGCTGGEVKCYINRWPAASQLGEPATPQITSSHSSFLTPIYSLARRSNRPAALVWKGSGSGLGVRWGGGMGGNRHHSIFTQHTDSLLSYDPSQARTNENNQDFNWDNQVNAKKLLGFQSAISSQLTSCPRIASAVSPMMQYCFNFIIFAIHYENCLNILGRMHQMNTWHDDALFWFDSTPRDAVKMAVWKQLQRA